jgi:murein DD-endopeptidase MepM/ murein hydrolase activator NlpD
MANESRHLAIRMPFPAGTAVICTQGSYTPAPHSHSSPNCLHALDFTSTRTSIVAVADGVVSSIVRSHEEGDSNGFGLRICLDHGRGILSNYCHLGAIHVEVGQTVHCGASIGLMGATGRTGAFPHLHFSLNEPIPGTGDPDETLFIHALIAADLRRSPVVIESLSSESFAGILCNRSAGLALFGSENAPGVQPVLGPCQGEILSKSLESAEELSRAFDTDNYPFVPTPPVDGGVSHEEENFARLQKAAKENPDDFFAAYWCAKAWQNREGGLAVAREQFLSLIDRSVESGAKTWIQQWSCLNVAEIFESEGENRKAIEAYEKVGQSPCSRNLTEVISRRLAKLIKDPCSKNGCG